MPFARPCHQDKVAKLFDLFDEDNSGDLTKKEFRRGVLALGLNAPAHELNELFDYFDANGDGHLSISEMTELIKGLEARVEAATGRGRPVPAMAASALSPSRTVPSVADTSAAPGMLARARESATAKTLTVDEEDEEDEEERETQAADEMALLGLDSPRAWLEAEEKRSTDEEAALQSPCKVSAAPSMVQVTMDAAAVAKGAGAAARGVGTTAVGAAAPAAARAASAAALINGTSTAGLDALTASAMRKRAADKLSADTAAEVQESYRTRIKEDLDRGSIWACKTFCLFPLLVKLTSLDHCSYAGLDPSTSGL